MGYQGQLDAFFGSVEGGELKKAIEDLYGPNPWQDAIQDQIGALKGQFITLPEILGEMHGYELLTEEKFGDKFIYLWYVVAYDRQPLSFHFTFYKPKGDWFLYSFEYKDDIQPLAQELARMKLLYFEDSSGQKGEKMTQSASSLQGVIAPRLKSSSAP
ncbi:MAG: hypothetical protein SX243_25020 [Acidobacteriota bacterium]|nr:hypothetical protein [Acidobacteriota bacterium]